MNGWSEYKTRELNLVDGNWFGFVIVKYENYSLRYLGLFINNSSFGWLEDYELPDLCGFYLDNKKI